MDFELFFMVLAVAIVFIILLDLNNIYSWSLWHFKSAVPLHNETLVLNPVPEDFFLLLDQILQSSRHIWNHSLHFRRINDNVYLFKSLVTDPGMIDKNSEGGELPLSIGIVLIDPLSNKVVITGRLPISYLFFLLWLLIILPLMMLTGNETTVVSIVLPIIIGIGLLVLLSVETRRLKDFSQVLAKIIERNQTIK